MEIVLGIVLTIVAVTLFGLIFEMVMRQRDKRFLDVPPGERLDVGGRYVHVQRNSREKSAPSVILLSTVGGTSLDWQLIQPKVAEFAPVLSYDRAGYGWTENIPGERTPERVVEELHEVLGAANMPAPYVIVGHGFGGLYARAYQAEYPQEVAGMVLVDSSHPELVVENDHRQEVRRQRNILRFRQIGILRQMLPRVVTWIKGLDKTAQQQYLAVRMHDVPMTLREVVSIFRDGIDLPGDLGDLPMRVISRGLVDEIDFSHRWREYQEDLATLSSRARHIKIQEGNHYLEFDQPDAVVAGIESLVKQIRYGDDAVADELIEEELTEDPGEVAAIDDDVIDNEVLAEEDIIDDEFLTIDKIVARRYGQKDVVKSTQPEDDLAEEDAIIGGEDDSDNATSGN